MPSATVTKPVSRKRLPAPTTRHWLPHPEIQRNEERPGRCSRASFCVCSSAPCSGDTRTSAGIGLARDTLNKLCLRPDCDYRVNFAGISGLRLVFCNVRPQRRSGGGFGPTAPPSPRRAALRRQQVAQSQASPAAGRAGGRFQAWDSRAGCSLPIAARESGRPCAPGRSPGGSGASCPGIPGRQRACPRENGGRLFLELPHGIPSHDTPSFRGAGSVGDHGPVSG